MVNTPTCDRCAKQFPVSISVSYKVGLREQRAAAPKTPDDALPADGFVDDAGFAQAAGIPRGVHVFNFSISS